MSDMSFLGLSPETSEAIGAEKAAIVRTFRLLHHLGQQLHFLADHLYREGGMTAQQAMLVGIVQVLGEPSLTMAANVFGSSHQNVKQIATALVRKGFLEMRADEKDGRVRRLATTRKCARYFASRDLGDFDVVATWFTALSPKEVSTLLGLLLKLHGSVRAAAQGVRP